MVKVVVDGIEVEVKEGSTILAAARKAGKKIPTLCFMKKLNNPGSCRVCVVQIEGEERMAASCNTPVCDAMVIHTNTPEVIRARKKNVEMLLSEHRDECSACPRVDTCALKALAADLCVEKLPFKAIPIEEKWDSSFPLQRDNTKCIKCMRCLSYCQKVQHCAVWDFSGTGAHMKLTVKDGLPINQAGCALCGQCITHCPTGALSARNDVNAVVAALMDPDIVTVVQVAPAVRSSWGEGVGLNREQASQGRMVSALRSLGFDYVFDTDFAADLTIMEEGSEVVATLKTKAEGNTDKLPVFTSCCPGWVRFAKQYYPQVVKHLSSAKSPHQMLGAIIKNTMKEEVAEQGKRIFCVSIMPCVAKKYECGVDELSTEVGRDVDAVLTVREFDRMLRMFSVDCEALSETTFDEPLGMSTGAGTIFGRTGGVMEAALRTAAFVITGENSDFSDCDCTAANPEYPWVDKTLELAGIQVKIAIASGLENTTQLLKAMESGEVSYDFVEIMACPGGCVAGGGQPISFNKELGQERAQVLNTLDSHDVLRRSYENPQVQKLYADWLGEPLGHLSHEWLHTNQQDWSL